MENVKKYYGVGDEVLPWAFYRIIEIEHLKAQCVMVKEHHCIMLKKNLP